MCFCVIVDRQNTEHKFNKEVNKTMKTNWKRNTVLFLISQTISMMGSSLVQYAIMWYITMKTQSGIMLTLSIICGFLPTFFLSPFAGVWADRYNRKSLIILADAMIALVTLTMAIIFMAGFDAIWLLFVASAIRAVGGAVQAPAVGAFLPQIVPEGQLTRINGINGSIQAMIMLVSPMVSGALLTLSEIQYIFFIDVITAGFAIATLLLFLRVPPHDKASKKQEVSYLTDMRLGFQYIREHRYLKKFFAYIGILLFLIAPAAFLTPLQVSRTFGNDVWRLTAIEICFSIGMMGGGILIATWGGFKNRMKTMVLSNIVMALCTLALGIIPIFWLYLAVMSLFGLVLPMYNTPSAVMIQEHVEENYMGRVFSVMTMISSSMMPLGMLVFGPLADIWPIEWLLIITGIIMFGRSIFVVKDKVLMEAGEPVVTPS